MSEEKKFVGPRAVAMVVVDEMKTYGGNDIVVVHYEGGDKEIMPKKTYELVSSLEQGDFTKVRDKKLDAILSEIYPLIGDYLKTLSKGGEEVKNARTEFLQKAIASISEWDVKVSETETLLNAIQAETLGFVNALGFEIDSNFNRATNFLWTNNDKEFIPGVNAMNGRTLLEAQKITKGIKIDESTKTPTE